MNKIASFCLLSAFLMSGHVTALAQINRAAQEISRVSPSTDVVMDITEVTQNGEKELLVSGVVRLTKVTAGDRVQLVGIEQKPLTTTVAAIYQNQKKQQTAVRGQSVQLVLTGISKDQLMAGQRVVVAKTRTEKDLKPVATFDFLMGQLQNGIYRNEGFGLTMNLKQPGFSPSLNRQEGFRYSFDHPEGFRDADIVRSYRSDYRLSMSVTSMKAVNESTAAERLAANFDKYNIQPVTRLLGDKQVAYAQVHVDEDRNYQLYAMIINGYYIEWLVAFKNENSVEKKKLDDMVNSISFDWVQE